MLTGLPTGKLETFLFCANRLPYGLLILWMFIALTEKEALKTSISGFNILAFMAIPLVIFYLNFSFSLNVTVAKRFFKSMGLSFIFTICSIFVYLIVNNIIN